MLHKQSSLESFSSEFTIADVFRTVNAICDTTSVFSAPEQILEKPEIFIERKSGTVGGHIKGAVILKDFKLISSLKIELRGTVVIGKGLDSPEFITNESMKMMDNDAAGLNPENDFLSKKKIRRKETRGALPPNLEKNPIHPIHSPIRPAHGHSKQGEDLNFQVPLKGYMSAEKKPEGSAVMDQKRRGQSPKSSDRKNHFTFSEINGNSEESSSSVNDSPNLQETGISDFRLNSKQRENPKIKEESQKKEVKFKVLPLPVIEETTPATVKHIGTQQIPKGEDELGIQMQNQVRMNLKAFQREGTMELIDFPEEDAISKEKAKEKFKSRFFKSFDQSSANYSSVDFFSYKKTIFESVYAITKKAKSLLFPFSFKVPEELPPTLYLSKGLQINYSLFVEPIKIRPNISLQFTTLPISYAIRSLRPIETPQSHSVHLWPGSPKESSSICFHVYSETLKENNEPEVQETEIQGRYFLSQKESKGSFLEEAKEKEINTAETRRDKIKVSLNRNLLVNEEGKNELRVQVITSNDFYNQRMDLTGFRVVLNEIMWTEESQRRVETQIFKDEVPMQIDYDVYVGMMDIDRFLPDIQTKAISISHELVGMFINNFETKKVFPLFRTPVVFQVTSSSWKESPSHQVTLDEMIQDRPDSCVSMPFAKIDVNESKKAKLIEF